MNFAQRLQEVQSRGLSAPRELKINLADVITDKEYNITGTSVYVFTAPDQTSYVSIKIGRKDVDPINCVLYTGFRAPFTKLFITTPAGQAGEVTIIIAAEERDIFEMIDNRSSISQTMVNVLEELQGITAAGSQGTEIEVGLTAVSVLAANADRKGAIIQSKDTNTGIIYVGFADTVSSTIWVVQLLAGMSWSIDDYRGPVYAISSVAAQLVGWGEW